MSPVIDMVRKYNELAIGVPENAWSPKFAHSRMEYYPGNKKATLNYGVWYSPGSCYIMQKIDVAFDRISEEINRLKMRASKAC
jgi:hypothetical protein